MNDTSTSPQKTKWSRQAKINAYIIGSLLAGGAIGLFLPFGADNWPGTLFVGLISLAMIIGVTATIHYTKLLDELARNTHEVAFYWSAVFTFAICMVPIAALIGFPDFELPRLEMMLGTKTHAFGTGMATSLLVLLVIYLVIWTYLWLKRTKV
jgi:hypothetical protein